MAVREALADTVMFRDLPSRQRTKFRHQQDIRAPSYSISATATMHIAMGGRPADAWMEDPVSSSRGPGRTSSGSSPFTTWAEILVAINLVFEPLVGRLVKDEFGRRRKRPAPMVIRSHLLSSRPLAATTGPGTWRRRRAW